MRLTLRRSSDIFPEEWQVTLFKDDHNHKLLSLKQVRFLSNYCSKRIFLFKEDALLVRKIMHIIELESNVKRGHLQLLANDIHNCLARLTELWNPMKQLGTVVGRRFLNLIEAPPSIGENFPFLMGMGTKLNTQARMGPEIGLIFTQSLSLPPCLGKCPCPYIFKITYMSFICQHKNDDTKGTLVN